MLVALAAVVLATAGGATAARLITSKQIRNGTIRSSDLSRALRTQINDSALARVGPDGTLLSGKGAASSSRTSAGDFQVGFRRSIERCAPVAAVRGTTGVEFFGFVTTYVPVANTVRVVIRDQLGNKVDGSGFNLAIVC